MSATTTRKPRVLVVDDEEKFCKIVAEFLQGRGYEAVAAPNGSEALQLVERFSPEVVLLDLIMPGLSGLDLLKLVRSRLFPPRVIIVTATEEVATQVLREGAETYVCKPISLEAVERLISGFWPPKLTPASTP